DVQLKATAEKLGVGETFRMAPVGVFCGDGRDACCGEEAGRAEAEPGEEVPDPYFGGTGPARRACTECGECMTGCRHGAKNMLTENYLHLAERAGAVVHPMTTVVGIRENPEGGYQVATVPTDKKRKALRGSGGAKVLTARQV